MIDGTAIAHASGSASLTNPYSTVTADAQSSGGAVLTVHAASSTSILGTSASEARASVGQSLPARTLSNGIQATAYATGLPTAADITNAVSNSPHANALVNGANVLGMFLLGGNNSSTNDGRGQTEVSSASFTIDFTQLPSLQDLQLVTLSPETTNSATTGAELEVFIRGTRVVNHYFSDAAETISALDDKIIDFGDIEAGTISNTVDIKVQLNIGTLGTDSGFSSLFMLANSPLVRLPGDYNDDGHVDSGDYAVWRSYDYYGVYDLAVDGNLDGVVDNLDYDVWRARFGQTASTGLGSRRCWKRCRTRADAARADQYRRQRMPWLSVDSSS